MPSGERSNLPDDILDISEKIETEGQEPFAGQHHLVPAIRPIFRPDSAPKAGNLIQWWTRS